MSNQSFDFCNTSRVIEEMPPEDPIVTSMNGWDFAAKPKTPYRRTFKVTLNGMIWYLAAGGASLNVSTDTTHNVGVMLQFYRDHRLWDSFLITHEYLGQIRVRFNKAIRVPAAIPNSSGRCDAVEVELIEHSPSYT